MQKMKKGIAVALTATMALGGTFTAYAADTATTGSTSGSGTSEGHVEQEVLNMVLPTVDSGSTPFAYIMDPERLIQGTDGNKYAEGTVFPAKDGDTGVYFLTAANTYANTSNTLQAINKSSCDVTLTVDVETTAGTKDIALATSSTPSETAAELYLGLKVGNDTETVASTKKTVTKTVAGSPTNFEIAVKNGAYVYQEKADATTWKAMNISMTGAVSKKEIASDTTAPTVNVTWSYAKAADGATVATDAVDYSAIPATSSAAGIVIPYDENATIAITVGSDGAVPSSLTTDWFAGNMLSMTDGWGAVYDAENKTITFDTDVSDAIRNDQTHTFTLEFTPDGGTAYTQTLTYAE